MEQKTQFEGVIFPASCLAFCHWS